MTRHSPEHEWDWPQRVRRGQRKRAEDEEPPTLNARIVGEQIQLMKPRVPLMSKIANWYLWTIVTVVKALVGAVLGLVILCAVWLLWAIVTLTHQRGHQAFRLGQGIFLHGKSVGYSAGVAARRCR